MLQSLHLASSDEKNAENMCFCSKSPRDTIENRVELDRILNTTVFEECSSIAQECIDTSGLLADDQGTTDHHLSNRCVPKTDSCLTCFKGGLETTILQRKTWENYSQNNTNQQVEPFGR